MIAIYLLKRKMCYYTCYSIQRPLNNIESKIILFYRSNGESSTHYAYEYPLLALDEKNFIYKKYVPLHYYLYFRESKTFCNILILKKYIN
ncbi:hypothetical protein PFTANZ_00488 [Plasmodium falciparum Tanzania (2000708)]|uniref:Uncharacterized protein n=1 Tax=Plasmodium falciparum Tanzania (2000708) TaxID=1036725 RepID=A0A024WDI5_PLAFA|nr:hypothetical protein PFTANZ_00488 [Plasmodium falciparum Tanzania (2000708)]